MKKRKIRGSASGSESGCSCIVMMFFFICNVILGGLSTQYCLWAFLGKTTQFIYCAIAGLFLGQFTVPGAILAWLLQLCGVKTPFFHVS